MTPIELVLSKLPDKKPRGNGWAARCPAHEDKSPSLSISEGDGGRALVHCHAGCTPEAIVTALGLKLADLMPALSSMARPMQRSNPKPIKVSEKPKPTFATAENAVADVERWRGRRAAMWTYHSTTGEPVGLVVRWNKADGKKDFLPVSKRADGRWTLEAMPDPRPLYHLPDLLRRTDERLYIAEGEKCADALVGLGLLATTSTNGGSGANQSDWTPLAGRDVVIVPDNDEAGRKYAEAVAGILTKLSPPATVRVVHLPDAWPDLPDGGDIADILENESDKTVIKSTLGKLVDEAQPQLPDVPKPAIEPFKPFPTDILPEPVRSFVRTCARAIGCDESYIALPLLTAMASAIGNTRCVQLKRGWTEPSILWAAVVGDSGTMKSPALEVALRAIRRRQQRAIKIHNEEMKQYQEDLKRWEREDKAWQRGTDIGLPPVKPEEPIADRCWCDDVTVEALAVLLKQQPRGLLLLRDELSGWLGGFDRYAQGSSADAAKWLEMHGGRPITVDRKSGNPKTIYVPRAAVSICGGIQPGTLSMALGIKHRENGLAARLLLASPPRRAKRWTETEIPQEIEQRIEEIFDRLFGLEPTFDDAGDAQPVIVTLSAAGKAAWINFYNAHGQEQAELCGDLSAAWSKLEGYAARLALVIHFIRWAAGDPTLITDLEIDAESIMAGVTLSRWFGNEARRVYATLGEDEDGRKRRRLVELIQRKGGTINCRELTIGASWIKTVSDAQSALEELVQHGLGDWEQPKQAGRGGPPSQRFVLKSDSGIYSNPIPDSATRNSVDVDAVDTTEATCLIGAGTVPQEDWGEV